MQTMGEAEVKPDGAVAGKSDLAARRDQMFHLGLVNGQIRELGGASGGVEGGDVEEHFWICDLMLILCQAVARVRAAASA